MLRFALDFSAGYVACGALHEAAHLLAAALLGCGGAGAFGAPNLASALLRRGVRVPQASRPRARAAIRHAGWLFSVALCVALEFWCAAAAPDDDADGADDAAARAPVRGAYRAAALATAAEALASDLLGLARARERAADAAFFGCGNFGMVLLDACWADTPAARDILQRMVEITMMRGAQSGGVVTYRPTRGGGCKGIRSRVVNAKRTDLSVLVRKRLEKDTPVGDAVRPPMAVRFYGGHTRFATTSKATFDGTHPHQWTPPRTLPCYDGFAVGVLDAAATPTRVETVRCARKKNTRPASPSDLPLSPRRARVAASRRAAHTLNPSPLPSPAPHSARARPLPLLSSSSSVTTATSTSSTSARARTTSAPCSAGSSARPARRCRRASTRARSAA